MPYFLIKAISKTFLQFLYPGGGPFSIINTLISVVPTFSNLPSSAVGHSSMTLFTTDPQLSQTASEIGIEMAKIMNFMMPGYLDFSSKTASFKRALT